MLHDHVTETLSAAENAMAAIETLRDALSDLIEYAPSEAEEEAVSRELSASRGLTVADALVETGNVALPDEFELDELVNLLTDMFYAVEEAEWEEEDDA